MFEQKITVSLSDVAAAFSCVAGLPYELKEPLKINRRKAVYAVPHFTSPICGLVDCTLLDKNFNSIVSWAETIGTHQLDEPVFERYLN